MERIIIDMDEVIADPMGEMIGWYKKQYGQDVDWDKMLVGSWLKGFPEEHQGLVMERLKGPGFFRHLPVMEDAVEVLRELNERYEVFIVSAAMEFPNSLKDKYDWLQEHFPFIGWQQIAFCGSKKPIAGDYMIDDHLKNLDNFNGNKLLFTAPHNINITGYTRVNDWEEVRKLLLN